MQILHVSTFFNEHGGVEKSVSDICRFLARNHSVHVLSTQKGKTERFVRDGIHVTASGASLTLSGRPLSISFPSLIRGYEVDVVHYHLPCPIAVFTDFFARPKAKVRVATWHHDLVRHPAFNASMAIPLERFLESLDLIMVTAPQLIENTPILSKFSQKCIVSPLGIDDARFEDVDHDAVLSLRKKFPGPLILYVGRLVYYKGCDVLLESMRSTRDANLIMVGTGPLGAELSRKIAEYGLTKRVHLFGWQPEEALQSLFQACDLFVLPSTLPTECFGLVQVEAMLCGKPVINTNLKTGVPWVSLNNETGLTVEPGNSTALANAINELINNDELRREFGAKAKKRAKSYFTLDKQLQKTIQTYESLLAGSKNRMLRQQAPVR